MRYHAIDKWELSRQYITKAQVKIAGVQLENHTSEY